MKLNICLRFLFCVTFLMCSTNAIGFGPIYPPPRSDAGDEEPPAPESLNQDISEPQAEAPPTEPEAPPESTAIASDDDYDFTFGIDSSLRISADYTLNNAEINYYPLLKFFKIFFTHEELFSARLKEIANPGDMSEIEQIPFYRKLSELVNTFEKEVIYYFHKFRQVKSHVNDIITDNDKLLTILGGKLYAYREKILRAWITISIYTLNSIDRPKSTIFTLKSHLINYAKSGLDAKDVNVFFNSSIENLLSPLDEGQTLDEFVVSIKDKFDEEIKKRHAFDLFIRATRLVENFETSAKELIEISAYKKVLNDQEKQKTKELKDKMIESYRCMSDAEYVKPCPFVGITNKTKWAEDLKELIYEYLASFQECVPIKLNERSLGELYMIYFIGTLDEASKNIVQLDKPPEISVKAKTDIIGGAKKALGHIKNVVKDGIDKLTKGSGDKTMLILTLFIPIQLVTMLLFLT